MAAEKPAERLTLRLKTNDLRLNGLDYLPKTLTCLRD